MEDTEAGRIAKAPGDAVDSNFGGDVAYSTSLLVCVQEARSGEIF
jgi:hypothetical protein